jgi:hypothetical protein
VQITAYNKALTLFFLRVLRAGHDSYTKRVPEFVFSSETEFINNLLDTYFAGDGYLYAPARKFQASSSSSELIQALFILLRMVGLPSSVYKFGSNFRLDLQGGPDFEPAKEVLRAMVKKKGAESLSNLEYRPTASHKIPVFVFAKGGRYPSALRQHVGGRFSENSRVSDEVALNLGIVDRPAEKFLEGDVQLVRVQKVAIREYHEGYYNIETDRDILPNFMHGYGIFSHNCSTRIPYKTVGKEYIGDRPEIQKEIRNAAREALRRLGIFLSRKGSAEAVQRKMNIYGKYLPLIARFSQELAGQERPPNYQNLIGEEGETTEVADGQTAEEETQNDAAAVENTKVIEIGQKKIDDEYSGE